MSNAIATIIPALLILLYKPENGGESRGMKYMFYAFYPLHLMGIGVVNILLKLF